MGCSIADKLHGKKAPCVPGMMKALEQILACLKAGARVVEENSRCVCTTHNEAHVFYLSVCIHVCLLTRLSVCMSVSYFPSLSISLIPSFSLFLLSPSVHPPISHDLFLSFLSAIDCGVPPVPTHSRFANNIGAMSTKFNAEIIVQCDEGHYVEGQWPTVTSFTMKCQRNQMWTTPLACVRKLTLLFSN